MSNEKEASIRVYESDKVRFKARQKECPEAGNQFDMFKILMDSFNPAQVFPPKSMEHLAAIAKETGANIDDVIVTGAMRYAEQLLKRHHAGETPTDMRIKNEVNALMAANTASDEWYGKVEITRGLLFKSLGCNRKNINLYMDVNQEMIDAHHVAEGIEPDHNRRVFNYNRAPVEE